MPQENRHLTRQPRRALRGEPQAQPEWLPSYDDLDFRGLAHELRAGCSSSSSLWQECKVQGLPHRDYCCRRSDAQPLREQGAGTSTASRCSSLQGWERGGLLPDAVQGACGPEGSLLPGAACCREELAAELGLHAQQGSLQARVAALEAHLAEAACAPQKDLQQLRQEVAGLHQAQLDMQARVPFGSASCMLRSRACLGQRAVMQWLSTHWPCASSMAEGGAGLHGPDEQPDQRPASASAEGSAGQRCEPCCRRSS